MTRTQQRINLQRDRKGLRNFYYTVAVVFAATLLAAEYILTHQGVV